MGWFYSAKYWKHATDIFKNSKDFLKYKTGYKKNYRLYYGVSSKEALYRKIYKDYMNIVIREVLEGNIVSLNNGVTFLLKEKKIYDIPYDTFNERLISEDKIPYIYMNTGEMVSKNKDFLVIPPKDIREELKMFKIVGKKYTKLFGKYFK